MYKEARSKRDSNDIDGAIKILEGLREGNSKSGLLNVTLASFYDDLSREKNDPDKMLIAERYYTEAVRCEPKSGLISGLYFHCLWRLGKRKEAIDEMIRYKAVGDPNDYKEIEEEYCDEMLIEIARIRGRLN